MGLIAGKKEDKIANVEVVTSGFKDDEILVYNKQRNQWRANSISGVLGPMNAIADASSASLADVITKFNTLLSELRSKDLLSE